MPIDRGAIDAQLKEIGEGERWWELREFRELPYVLNDEERIAGLVSGKLLASRRPRVMPSSPWLLIATNQRLICLKQERFGRKQVELRQGQITGIQHRSGVRGYQITLETVHRRYRIRIPKSAAFRFIGALQPLMPNPAQLPAGADPMAALFQPAPTGLAAIPGLSRFVSRAPALPAPEYATRAELERVYATVEHLTNEVERLQQQVEFLEKLLHERAEGMAYPGSRAGA